MTYLHAIACCLLAVGMLPASDWREVATIPNANPNYKPAIHVDRSSGDCYLSSGSEIRISRDQGASWDSALAWQAGRHYNSNAFDGDWRPGRVALFPIISPTAKLTLDGGATWIELPRPQHDGWTYGAVDWSSEEPRQMLGKEHHSTNLWYSDDTGLSWRKLDIEGYFGLGFSPQGAILVGAIDGKKSVIPGAGVPGIYRSDDDGVSWSLVHACELYGKVKPRCFEDTVYWSSPEGLLISSDDGRTWSLIPDSPTEIAWGPFFGENDTHIVVVGARGIHKTSDGGMTWQLIAAKEDLPVGMKEYRLTVGYDFAWDPVHDIYYGTTGAQGSVMCLHADSQQP